MALRFDDPLYGALLSNPNFVGPVDKTPEIAKQTDQGWFQPPGDPYNYKWIDGKTIAFRNPATGKTGMLDAYALEASNPNFLRQDAIALTLDAFEAGRPTPSQFLPRGAGGQAGSARQGVSPAQPRPTAPLPITLPQMRPEDDMLTPPGTAAPSELSGTGKALAAIGDALSNPMVQQALNTFGMAIAGPNTPAQQIGQQASGLIDRAAESRYVAGLMAGRPVEELERELVGISPEARQRAESTVLGRRADERAERQESRLERSTDASIRQGDERIDIAREGLALDQERFKLMQSKEQFDQEITKQKLQIDQQLADSRLKVDAATRQLQIARATNVGSEGSENRLLDLRRIQTTFTDAVSTKLQMQQQLATARAMMQRAEAKNWKQYFDSEEARNFALQGAQETISQIEPQLKSYNQMVTGLERELNNYFGVGDTSTTTSSESKPKEISDPREAASLSEGEEVLLNGTVYKKEGNRLVRVR